MIFKYRNGAVAILISIGLIISGCSDFLKGKATKQDVIKLQVADNNCYANLLDKVNKIKDLEADSEEINEVFSCLDLYLTQFQNKVNGALVEDIYEISDLSYITSRFFKKQNIDPATLELLLRFKTALVGGKTNQLKKSEVNQLKTLLKLFNVEFNKVYNYSETLKTNTNRSQNLKDRERISESFGQLKSSTRQILLQTQIWKSDLTFDDAIKLLKKFEIITEENEKTISLVKQVQNLVAASSSMRDKENILAGADSLVDMGELHILAKNGFAQFEMTSAEHIENIIYFFDKAMSTLENTPQFKTNQTIDLKTFDPLLETLLDQKIVPIDLKFETLKSFYKIILARIFTDNLYSGQPATKLTAETFKNYRKEAALYRLSSRFNELVFKRFQTNRLTAKEISSALEPFLNSDLSDIFTQVGSAEVEMIKKSFYDMQLDLLSSYPVVINSKKQVLDLTYESYRMNWEDLSREIYVKSLARLLHQGWGDLKINSVRLKDHKLTKNQYITFRNEFRPLGIELKLTDPRMTGEGSKSFLEANLFSYSSDGDQLMSYQETFRYLNYLITEGAWAASDMRHNLEQRGCNLDEKDVFDYPKNSYNCVFEEMRDNYKIYFANKPQLIKFLSSLSKIEFVNYFQLLMKFALLDEKNNGVKLETVDIQSFLVIASYIETLFVQFDLNKNSTLSADEFRLGYPKFKSFVTDYVNKNEAASLKQWKHPLNPCRLFYSVEDVVRESFIFMALNDGKRPEKKDFNIMTCAVRNILTHKTEVDRMHILNTFLQLKSILSSYK